MKHDEHKRMNAYMYAHLQASSDVVKEAKTGGGTAEGEGGAPDAASEQMEEQ
jgi:hypothetical protein